MPDQHEYRVVSSEPVYEGRVDVAEAVEALRP